LSELASRWALIGSQELIPFFIDINSLFEDEILDFYLIGFRWGLLYAMLMDFKLTS